MKSGAFILSIYLLLLAVIPCCSFDDCSEDAKYGQTTASHEEEDRDCGNCSPFFSCEGCAAATISSTLHNPGIPSVPEVSVFTFYIPQRLPSMEFDVWQPPRLG